MMKYILKWTLILILITISTIQLQAQQNRKDWQIEVGESANESRVQWKQLTSGIELARDKKVQFFPKPNYRLTTDDNDAYDLTDGTLSSRADDRVWFNKDAVGWNLGVGTTNGVLIVIDLGAMQPVRQIAVRVLGGREQRGLELPASIEFLASADGREYYQLQRMMKLNSAEQEQSDFKTGFYIPEEGKVYMTPLVSREAVNARYIALRIWPQSSLFIDQISIQKAQPDVVLKDLKSFPRAQVYTDGLVVMPRHNPFVVTTNIATPNWLMVQDNSGLNPAKEKLGFRLELPQGLRLLDASRPLFNEVAANTNVYEFNYDGKNSNGAIGPLWIEKIAGASIPVSAKVKLTGLVQGRESHTIESPLQLVSIPEVPFFTGLDISLAWITDGQQQNWPHFLRDFRKMGFGSVSTFPRYFSKDKTGSWDEPTRQSLAFLKQARSEGYEIVYNESPFHVMWNNVQAAQKAGQIDEVEARDIYNYIGGKRGQRMSPLYRGKYYQDEIKRVADSAALIQPDHVYLDIEWWHAVITESKQDPRMVTAWKESGQEWDDFVTDIGTEVLGAMVTAMRQAVPQKKMTVGLYNSDPKNKIYHSVFQFDKIYPGIVNIAQPSLYIQGRPQVAAERIRFDYDVLQKSRIVPWLSAGTYGEFAPELMEPMIHESILNGSNGVTYYKFNDFDPLDFYYHAKALALLASHEKLLQTGKPIAYRGDNSTLHYTAFASDSQALVLIGNYENSAKTKVTLPLPFAAAKKATMDGKALAIRDDAVTLDVPQGEFRLISIER